MDERVEALLAQMMQRELFVVFSEPNAEPARLRPHLEAHLEFMIELEGAGMLFASGPLFSADGTMTGQGITVLRAASFEEARTIAERDPFVREGLRTFSIKRWTINEGRIDLSVRLSDRSGRVP